MRKITLPTLAILFLCGAAQAREPIETITTQRVVVTGTRTEKRLSESPILTTLIGERDIRKAASVSMLESLQDNIPGIVVTPNAMGNNMRIKGLNSRYILFLVDGERLVSEGAGGNINLGQIDLNTIKRIEIVDGAASALYGSNAVGAVINIITKEPCRRFEAGAFQSWQSHGTLRSAVDAGTVRGRFSAHAGAMRNSSNGFDTRAARYEDWGADMKLGYGVVKTNARWFRHETFNEKGSMNVAHGLADNFAAGVNAAIKTLKLSANLDKFLDYDALDLTRGRNKKNTAAHMAGRAVDIRTLGKHWELVSGAEWTHESNWSVKTLGTEPRSKNLDDASLFAQGEWHAGGIDIVGGARYTRNWQFGGAFTPKISAMWRAGDFRLRGGVGTAFRAPSIKELYYDFDHQGMFWIYGNPLLRPERGLYTSLSAEYLLENLNVSAALYNNRISNKIIQYDIINTRNEKHYTNVSRATLRGIDLNASGVLWRHLQLRGSYSFCDARDNSTGRQLSSNVRHSGTVSASWNEPFGSLLISGRLNSPIIFYDEDSSESRSKAYSVWKAVLTVPIGWGVEAAAKVENLFNFRERSFVDPGRQFLISLRYNFKTRK